VEAEEQFEKKIRDARKEHGEPRIGSFRLIIPVIRVNIKHPTAPRTIVSGNMMNQTMQRLRMNTK